MFSYMSQLAEQSTVAAMRLGKHLASLVAEHMKDTRKRPKRKKFTDFVAQQRPFVDKLLELKDLLIHSLENDSIFTQYMKAYPKDEAIVSQFSRQLNQKLKISPKAYKAYRDASYALKNKQDNGWALIVFFSRFRKTAPQIRKLFEENLAELKEIQSRFRMYVLLKTSEHESHAPACKTNSPLTVSKKTKKRTSERSMQELDHRKEKKGIRI